jgi:hypothetical protein
MNVAFFIRHFTERGTEVATYDYANYNELILKNKSYIICFTESAQRNIRFPPVRHSYDKFKSRFPIVEINAIEDMKYIINDLSLNFFYTQTDGCRDIYHFNNTDIWNKCKTIKHCVFNTTFPESDYYISISKELNIKNNTNLPVIPYMVDLPNNNDNLRASLKIPTDATVFGRYGGMDQFDIKITHQAIIEHVNADPNVYFLLMNTDKFYEHPRILYLDKQVDLISKVKFINTCDAMIHARVMGETFGLAVAEFSSKNKPVITCPCGDIEHISILGDKAILYTSKDDLINIFKNMKTIVLSKTDWNAYKSFTPVNIMNLFSVLIFNNV